MGCVIHHGDALDAHLLEPESIDLVVTSPPYNLGKAYTGDGTDDRLAYDDYLSFSRSWMTNCYTWGRSTARLCMNITLDIGDGTGHKRAVYADLVAEAVSCGWQYRMTILWDKGHVTTRTAWGSWRSARAPHIVPPAEVIVVLFKDDWRKEPGEDDLTTTEFIDWTLGLWAICPASATLVGHEAPFPPELPRRLIKLFSFRGDTVLDPFTGSGTTLIEAILHQRHAVGIEKQAHYHALATRRLSEQAGLFC